MDNVSPNPIYVAVDTPDLKHAMTLATTLSGYVGGLKLGLEFFTAHGIEGVRQVAQNSGLPLFLDLKFHDIPNTVAGAVRAACAAEPIFLTVHAMGGPAMMEAAAAAARDGAGEHQVDRPKVMAVSVLTSLDQDDMGDIGLTRSSVAQARALALLAQQSRLDGVICSAHEVAAVRHACGPHFTVIVPGVRPSWTVSDDQKRTTTPAKAMAAGADYVVVGRPITGAGDPAAACRRLLAEVTDETGRS